MQALFYLGWGGFLSEGGGVRFRFLGVVRVVIHFYNPAW